MQSIQFSQISQCSQTTHKGLSCDLVIKGQAYTIRKNSQGGMIPALGTVDRKSTRLNSSHPSRSRMPSSA